MVQIPFTWGDTPEHGGSFHVQLQCVRDVYNFTAYSKVYVRSWFYSLDNS